MVDLPWPSWDEVPELTPEEELECVEKANSSDFYFSCFVQVCVTAKDEAEAREKVEHSILTVPLQDGVFGVGTIGNSQDFQLINVGGATLQQIRESARWSKYLDTIEMPYPPMPPCYSE